MKREEALSRERTEMENRIQELRNHGNNKTFAKEYSFLQKISSVDSRIRIWDIWCETGLAEIYVDLNKFLESCKDAERFYGKTPREVEKVKETIKRTLLKE